MPYLVIDADRAIVSGGILPTQTAADTLAATDSEWTAHQGDVIDPAFHANAEPGWFLTTAGVTVGELPPTALQALQNVMSEAHHYMVELQEQLHIEGSGRLWPEVVTVHNYFARVHQSNYTIVKTNPGGLSVADRTRYATALLAGPQSTPSVRLTVSELFDAIVATGTSLGTDQGVTYVNPLSGVQVTIAASLANDDTREQWGLGSTAAAMVVTEAQLVSGQWTEGITA